MQARATRGVHRGTWYFEIRVTHLGPTGHCRLGWSTKKGELQVREAMMPQCEEMHLACAINNHGIFSWC